MFNVLQPLTIRIWCCLLLLLVANNTMAQGDSTIVSSDERFSARQLIVPGALITIGALGVDNGWLRHVRNDVRTTMQRWRGQTIGVDDYVQYLPVVSNVALGLCGIPGRHSNAERLCLTATAYAAMGLMVNGTKHLVREPRPDTGKRNAFPSGHTATAFMGAELVRSEYGTDLGIAAYTVATGVAVLRLYNDRHWANDVVAAAGMGILSARIAYWLLPLERRLFGLKHDAPLAAVPVYSPSERNVALTLTIGL